MEEDDSKVIYPTTPLNEVVWYHGSLWYCNPAEVWNEGFQPNGVWEVSLAAMKPLRFQLSDTLQRYGIDTTAMGTVISAKQFHVLELAEDRGFVLCYRKKKAPR